jgi:hypothetical protein
LSVRFQWSWPLVEKNNVAKTNVVRAHSWCAWDRIKDDDDDDDR